MSIKIIWLLICGKIIFSFGLLFETFISFQLLCALIGYLEYKNVSHNKK